MKRLMAALLAALALFSVAFAAEPVDLTTYTDAELLALVEQAGAELRTRNTPAVPDDPLADLRYASNGTEVRIVKYIGTTGEVYIPDEIDSMPVTQLYNNMCERNNDVYRLRLPSELVSIGEYAFSFNDNLQHDLVMPTTLEKINRYAFAWSNVSGLVLQSDCLLDENSFAGNDTLKFCYIREGCTVTLTFGVFSGTPIEAAVIPASVTSIHPYTFNSCNNLTVYCPAGSYAEQYCKENFIVCDTANYETMVAYYEALYPAE